MDPWMEYQSKAWDRREAERQRAVRRLLREHSPQRAWRKRTALRCGLLLMRCARRLIAYGKPQPEHRPPLHQTP